MMEQSTQRGLTERLAHRVFPFITQGCPVSCSSTVLYITVCLGSLSAVGVVSSCVKHRFASKWAFPPLVTAYYLTHLPQHNMRLD